MGRNRIYKTPEDKYEAEKRWKREWYYRHQEQIKKLNLVYYHKHKYEKVRT